MPTSETFRWYGWRGAGAASEPEPVAVRCSRCTFVAEGDLEHAREAFAAHECDPAACRSCNSSLGDRVGNSD